MFWTEYRCQSRNPNQFEDVGRIRLHSDGENMKKSPQIVIVKLVATVGMLVVGLLMVTPSIPLPPVLSIAVSLGVLLVYVGVAYFIRPEPNTDNLGGVFGTDDMTQYNDDINRNLLSLYMVLGPGRFVSETFIDAATLCGIVPERTQDDIDQSESEKQQSDEARRLEAIEAKVEAHHESREHQGQVQLSSMKFLNGQDDDIDDN